MFYLGCMLTMATVPRDSAVTFFNSLLHGLDVGPILKTSVPPAEVLLGLVSTSVLGWFAGVLTAGFYNLSLRMKKLRLGSTNKTLNRISSLQSGKQINDQHQSTKENGTTRK